jgi:hypothetical protein
MALTIANLPGFSWMRGSSAPTGDPTGTWDPKNIYQGPFRASVQAVQQDTRNLLNNAADAPASYMGRAQSAINNFFGTLTGTNSTTTTGDNQSTPQNLNPMMTSLIWAGIATVTVFIAVAILRRL